VDIIVSTHFVLLSWSIRGALLGIQFSYETSDLCFKTLPECRIFTSSIAHEDRFCVDIIISTHFVLLSWSVPGILWGSSSLMNLRDF
jgi:hypothetical protein